MSTLEADAVTAATGTNTALSLRGKGTGKVALGDASLLVPDADGAAGQIATTDGSANLTFAATPGTSGNVLTSNGSAWTSAAAAGSSGAWTLIATSEAGGGSGVASMTFTGIAVASYECYALVMSRVRPVNDQADLLIRIGSSGTPATSGYNNQNVYNGTANTGSTAAVEVTDSVRSSTDGTGVGIAWIHPFLTDSVTSIMGQFYSPSAANIQSIFGGALPAAAGDGIDRIQILFDTGNILYGRVTLYGIAGHVA
jgi:hypothetical protein